MYIYMYILYSRIFHKTNHPAIGVTPFLETPWDTSTTDPHVWWNTSMHRFSSRETVVMPKDLLRGFNVFLPPTTGNFMVKTKKIDGLPALLYRKNQQRNNICHWNCLNHGSYHIFGSNGFQLIQLAVLVRSFWGLQPPCWASPTSWCNTRCFARTRSHGPAPRSMEWYVKCGPYMPL